MTLVHHFLELSALNYPHKVAVVSDRIRATYSDINEQSNRLASFLISKGVQKADRIVLMMQNGIDYIVAYYAILKSGAVAVPLNADLKSDDLRYAISDLGSKIMISSSRFEKTIVLPEILSLGISDLIIKRSSTRGSNNTLAPSFLEHSGPTMIADFDSVTSQNSATALQPAASQADNVRCGDLQETDLASIIYTSGSTGGPKGVMLSHQNIVENTLSICKYLQLTSEDIQMVVLPFSYVMGKSLLNTHFAVGARIIVNNQFAFPAAVLNQMVAEKVTGFSGVPSTFAYLVHRSPLQSMRDQLVTLRYVSQAGGHMPKAIKEELLRILPKHTKLFVMYGATEAAARLSYLDPDNLEEKIDSIGKAIPGVTLKVLNDQGGEAAKGEVGELCACGPNIMQGYWRKPEATAKVLIDNWYHTGDQAYMDDDGFFFVVGRKDDLIKVGGHRLNPQEIEDRLLASELFVEALVFGLPDELLGYRLAALCVPKSGNCTLQTIMSYCIAALPNFKIPSEVRFLKALPKKTSGKIDKTACRQLWPSALPAL